MNLVHVKDGILITVERRVALATLKAHDSSHLWGVDLTYAISLCALNYHRRQIAL